MSEEKKRPKIDLKARLGKKNQAAAAPDSGGDVPPPPSGVPAPPSGIAPPPGLTPAIPAPPFGPPPKKKKAEPKPTAQAQTIKVEVGEEIHQERKRSTRKVILFAAITAVLGGAIGFVAGGANERGNRHTKALNASAGLLEKVDAANGQLKDLAAKLEQANTDLKNKSYPTDLGPALEKVIEFDGSALDGSHVGSMPGDIQRTIFAYTAGVEALNQKRESLGRIIDAAKPSIEKAWEREKEPVFQFSVTFSGSKEKMTASLVTVKDPFKLSEKEWPEKYTVQVPERKGDKMEAVDKESERWVGDELADPMGKKTIAIPVQPRSVAAFTSDQDILKLRSAILDLFEAIQGNAGDPNAPPGLLQLGEGAAQGIERFQVEGGA